MASASIIFWLDFGNDLTVWYIFWFSFYLHLPMCTLAENDKFIPYLVTLSSCPSVIIISDFAKFVSTATHDQQNLGKFAKADKKLVSCNRKLMRTDMFSLGPPYPYAISWTLIILYFIWAQLCSNPALQLPLNVYVEPNIKSKMY